MIKKRLRKLTSALLMLSMCANMMPGKGMVSARAESSRTESHVQTGAVSVIRLNPEKLWEAAEDALDKGDLVMPPEVLVVAESWKSEEDGTIATPSDADVFEINYETAFYENQQFQTPSYELENVESLLESGEKMPDQTTLRIFLEPDWSSDRSELTGDENLIFMIVNHSAEARGYQIQFGSLVTDVMVSESQSRMLKAYRDDLEESAVVTVSASPAAAVRETAAGGGGGQAGATERVETQLPGDQLGEDQTAGEELVESLPAGDETAEDQLVGDEEEESQPGGDEEEESQPDIEGQEESQPVEKDDIASPGNASMAKADWAERLFQIIFNPITSYAALKATDNDALKEDYQDETIVLTGALSGGQYTRLETAFTSALIRSQLESIDQEAETMYMTAFALTEEEEFEAKKSNTSSVILFKTALSNFSVDVEEGNGIFTINMYDYAPYSGQVSYTAKNDSNEDVAYENVYNTYRNRLFINSYLSSLGSSLRFGRPVNSKVADATERKAYNDYSYEENETTKYFNITQGIPAAMDEEVSDGSILDILFPESDVKYTFDVNGDGTEEETEVIKVYNDISNGDGLDNAFLKVIEDGDDGADEYKGYWRYTSDTHKVEFSPQTHAIRRGSEQLEQDDPSKPDQTKWGFWPFGETQTSNKYYFGMTVDFDFYKEKEGYYNPETKEFADKEMEYWFSGDDDIWVYLTSPATDEHPDGVEMLALDLGGVHDRVSGSINFATGTITYETMARTDKPFRQSPLIQDLQGNAKYQETLNGDPIPTEGPIYIYLYDDKSADELKEEGYADCLNFPRTAGIHHLKLYYMERGDGDSNYSMRFNLPVVPKSGLSVTKQVTGTKEHIEQGKNTEYQVDFLYSENLEALKAVYEGGDIQSYPQVTKETITVKGGERKSTENDTFLKTEDYWFYLEEKDNQGAIETKWHVSDVSGPKVEVEKAEDAPEGITPIYRVDAFSGVSCTFVCENIYDEASPKLSKRAWRDSNELAAVYDITLEVDGDSLYSTAVGDDDTERKIKQVIAVDQLSSYVELSDTVAVDGLTGPRLYLSGGKATSSNADKPSDDSVKKTELSCYKAIAVGSQATPNNAIQYSLEEDGEATAVYHPDSRTITWYVADELGENDHWTLTFKVEASDLALPEDGGQYPDQGDDDTGTHENGLGYYSNALAKVEYETIGGETEEEEFPKPVIQPVNRSVELTKLIDGSELVPGEEYSFAVQFHMADGRTLTREQLKIQIISSDGSLVGEENAEGEPKVILDESGTEIAVKMKKGETLQLKELPKDVLGYTVTESLKTYEKYQISLEKISHSSDDADIQLQSMKVSSEFAAREQRDEMTFTNKYRKTETPPTETTPTDKSEHDNSSKDSDDKVKSYDPGISEEPEKVPSPVTGTIPSMGDDGTGMYILGLMAAIVVIAAAVIQKMRKKKYRP